MTYRWLTSLADDLRAAGVKVVEEPGWKTRGHSPSKYGFDPRFVVWHHDASAKGESPGVVRLLVNGDGRGLEAPYAGAWVAMDGTWHLIAAGHAYHAGAGGPYAGVPRDAMNGNSFGIETDHTTGEAWPPAQIDSLRKGTAAILKRLDAKPDPGLLFHKTWAPGRKTDPDGLDLAHERAAVAAFMAPKPTGGGAAGSTGVPTPPAKPSTPAPPKHAAKPIVHLSIVKPGKRHAEIRLVQKALGMPRVLQTGYYGTLTKKAAKAFQAKHFRTGVDGVLGRESLTLLGFEVRP